MTTSQTTDPTSDAEKTREIGAPSDISSAEATTEPGRSLGRYVILRELGRGGMAFVYAAYDPELDRQVALKLMRPASLRKEESRERLLREAQALARLSHPNVVHVYDVGTYEGQVYMAMELVQGQTLSAWIGREKPGWRNVLEKLEAAGRGLAAAHEAGLVHLDFKPSNVLIGEDGRVCVVDFGLARPPRGPESIGGALSPDPDASTLAPVSAISETTGRKRLDERLTEYGVVMGTPGYMSPELLTGAVVDARADVFAFCVTAWRCLWGELPFAGDVRALLERNIIAGKIRPLPKSGRVPHYVRRALIRGLAVEPRDRPTSMDAVLTALSAKRHDRMLIAVGVCVVALAAGTASMMRSEASVDCNAAASDLGGVFDASRREAARAAFVATRLPTAEQTWSRVEAGLDGWAARWASQALDACEATHVRKVQSEEVLDRRRTCLERGRTRLSALLGVLADADARAVEHASDIVTSLPPPEECASVDRAVDTMPPPDPEQRDAIAAAEEVGARGSANRAIGRYDEAVELFREALAQSEKVGYRPYVANFRGDVGATLALAGRPQEAAPLVDQALWEVDSLGLDTLRLRYLIAQVFIHGNQLGDLDRAEWYAEAANAVAERLGGQEAEIADLLTSRGVVADHRGNHELALQFAREALEMRRSAGFPRDINDAVTLDNAGNALYHLGRYDEALANYHEALEIRESAVGPLHPSSASTHQNIANVYRQTGRLDDALEEARYAVSTLESLGEHSGHRIGQALNTLGVIYAELERRDEAAEVYRRAYDIMRASVPDSPQCAAAALNLAEAETVAGRLSEARVHAEEARTKLEASLGSGHVYLANVWLLLGRIEVERGDAAAALAAIDRAESFMERDELDPLVRAEGRYWKARAVFAADPGRLVEAKELADDAAHQLAKLAPRGKGTAEALQRWLAELPAK